MILCISLNLLPKSLCKNLLGELEIENPKLVASISRPLFGMVILKANFHTLISKNFQSNKTILRSDCAPFILVTVSP